MVCDRTGPRGQPAAYAAYRATATAREAAILPVFDCDFVCFRRRMAGESLCVRPVVAGGNTRRAAFSAGFAPAGGAGSVQRLPAAPPETASWGGGARAICAGTARWSGAVADRGGDAGGCSSASDRDFTGRGGRRTGPHSGFVARGGSEAAGTDAADEVDRR